MSLTTVHKDVIQTACINALAYIKKTRAELYEKAILKVIAASTRGWFGYVKQPISREWAIRNLRDLELSEWCWLDCDWIFYGSGIKIRAERLLKATELTAENLIALDLDDVEFVHNWK